MNHSPVKKLIHHETKNYYNSSNPTHDNEKPTKNYDNKKPTHDNKERLHRGHTQKYSTVKAHFPVKLFIAAHSSGDLNVGSFDKAKF